MRGLADSLDPVVVGMGRVGTRPDLPVAPKGNPPISCLSAGPARRAEVHVRVYWSTLLTVVTRVSAIPVHFAGARVD